jgi:hypothetical protein
MDKPWPIGTRVKIVDVTDFIVIKQGAIGTVIGYIEEEDPYFHPMKPKVVIKWDNQQYNNTSGSSLCCISRFVALEEPKKVLSSCPKCGGELKDQYSDWAKENIKKCSVCKWC